MNTNDLTLLQQLAAERGYHLTGPEIAALCALPHVLALHFWASVRYWQYIGGAAGLKRFFTTGSTKPISPNVSADEPKKTP